MFDSNHWATGVTVCLLYFSFPSFSHKSDNHTCPQTSLTSHHGAWNVFFRPELVIFKNKDKKKKKRRTQGRLFIMLTNASSHLTPLPTSWITWTHHEEREGLLEGAWSEETGVSLLPSLRSLPRISRTSSLGGANTSGFGLWMRRYRLLHSRKPGNLDIKVGCRVNTNC